MERTKGVTLHSLLSNGARASAKTLIKKFQKKLLKILSVQKLVVTLHRFSLQDGAVKKSRENIERITIDEVVQENVKTKM